MIELEESYENADDQLDNSNEREQRIQEYLDVDKEQYLNRNEYEEGINNRNENSEEWVNMHGKNIIGFLMQISCCFE